MWNLLQYLLIWSGLGAISYLLLHACDTSSDSKFEFVRRLFWPLASLWLVSLVFCPVLVVWIGHQITSDLFGQVFVAQTAFGMFLVTSVVPIINAYYRSSFPESPEV